MNIFILDIDPIISAQSLLDKHVVKMPLESAQMLCSVFNPGTAPYKRSYYNHPCSKWVRNSSGNFDWLVEHGLALCDEYNYRYGKIHKCKNVIEWCRDNINGLSDLGLTPFAQAMLDKYKSENAVESYRAYYIGEKNKLLVYTKRQPPMWLPIGLAIWKQ